ncbi:hypothetical protein NUU61_007755 [Penicillium alfredii]|uniref:Mitochondrial thiamine pyrophosphate carrier 1 n=1 Tax=Penicillium alfredii TaxID=1506179 RepID=A0A9W9ER27_9EURO|nr:uncharacterized protein NUU61_007755 [Penicillium alfredii]KAJ5086448.1 hypothetical protein NUU61_007755 [Penicillium alfredii]
MYNSHTDIWIAGAFAAVIVDFIVYPVDTLKTRIQSPDYEKVYKDARTGAVRRNVLFRGVYQGVWSVVFATIPSSGAFFTTYEAVKSTLHDSSNHSAYTTDGTPNGPRLPFTHSLPSPIIHAIASSTAEMVACLMLTPAEVLKQNAQMINGGSGNSRKSSDNHHGTGSRTAMRQVLARFRRHPSRLWSGYMALVGRNLPFTGLQFPIFECVRSHLIDWRWRCKAATATASTNPNLTSNSSSNGNSSSSDVDSNGNGSEIPFAPNNTDQLIERAGLTGLSASISGTLASIVTTPIDVIKTRVMLSASNNYSSSNSNENAKLGTNGSSHADKIHSKGTFAVGRDIFCNEGIRGLFKGGAIRAGWTAVSLSMYLSLYEGGRFYLENRRRERDGVDRPGVRSEDGEAVM